MNILAEMKTLLDAVLRPGRFFANPASAPAPWSAGLAFVLLLVFAAILLFLSGLVWDAPLAGNFEASALAAGTSLDLFSRPAPLARFYFPLYWVLYALLVFLVRHATLKIFGSTITPGSTLLVCVIGALPMALVSALQGIINNLLPLDLAREPHPAYIVTRMALSFLFFLISFAGEGRVLVPAFRTLGEQNTGRAVLVWLAPELLALQLLALYIILR